MAEQGHPIKGIDWRELLPFTHLFRAFRVAIDWQKMLLALALLLSVYAGGRLLDSLWPNSHLARSGDLGQFVGQDFSAVNPAAADLGMTVGFSQGIFLTFISHQIEQVNRVAYSALRLDVSRIWQAVYDFVVTGPVWLFKEHPIFTVLFGAWFLLLWSLLGGAISRIAAVHVARDEKISFRQALRFSSSKLLSFMFAPLIPLIILLGLGALLAAGGLLLYVPYLGSIVVGVGLVFALAAGFVMTLVLIGTIGGFNLMFPTVAVEGSDSFDAISRSFSYVFTRPWKTLWYTFVALVYGGLTYLFVRLFLYLVLSLTRFFVGWWLGHSPRAFWFGETGAVDGTPINPLGAAMWPAPDFVQLPYTVDFAHLAWPERVAAAGIMGWVYLAISLLGAYAISYYFSANTIIYALLRREVDATELDDVYLDQSDEDLGDLAVEPVPAAEAAMSPVEPAAPAAASTPVSMSTPAAPSTPAETPPPAEPPPADGKVDTDDKPNIT